VQAIVLRPGEIREGADFRMVLQPAACQTGVIVGGPSTELELSVESADPLPGWRVPVGKGKTNTKGEFTVCGLSRGRFQVRAVHYTEPTQPPLFGAAEFEIPSRAEEALRVPLTPAISVVGEVVWAEESRPNVDRPTVRLVMRPEQRDNYVGESIEVTTPVPGEFSWPNLLTEAYRLQLYSLPRGVYAKSISYGMSNPLIEPFRVGDAMGAARVHIVLACDGAYVRAHVIDAKSQAVRDAMVVVFPEKLALESDMARWVNPFPTASGGLAVSSTLPPGRYRILAVTGETQTTPAFIRRLFELRSKAVDVELASGAVKDVTVKAVVPMQ
jgi:hypothetical protein